MKKVLLLLVILLVTFVSSAQIDFKGVYIGYKQDEVSKYILINGGNYWLSSFNVKDGYCVGIICIPISYDEVNIEPRYISKDELLALVGSISKSYTLTLEFNKDTYLFLGFQTGLLYEVAIVDVKEGYSDEMLYQITLRILNIELHEQWQKENPKNPIYSNKRYN